jgi:PAS domain S-box-containing protein
MAQDCIQIRNVFEARQGLDAEDASRFKAAVSNLESIALMLDRDARITYCNDYLLRLTGWQRAEVTGRDWFEFFVPAELKMLPAVLQALLANQSEAWYHENEILTRSGGRRLISWNNTVLRSTGDEVTGTASVGEDVTEQR